ncbi:MAG: flavin reductase family protein [Lachnospiraceae bacterium]|nr:flavin reductase family protein [Lachnospiraceae bacterium]
MSKIDFRPGNMLYPLPAIMVTCQGNEGIPNIITLAWAGTVCSDPAMVSISVKKQRFSHHLLMESGEFVINLTTKDIVRATDYCGVTSGRDVNKFAKTGLTPIPSKKVAAPSIKESPVNIECKVKQVLELGSHDMFLAEVVHVSVDASLMDEKNTLHLKNANLISYSHGRYFVLGKELGTFGYSIRKRNPKKKKRRK